MTPDARIAILPPIDLDDHAESRLKQTPSRESFGSEALGVIDVDPNMNIGALS